MKYALHTIVFLGLLVVGTMSLIHLWLGGQVDRQIVVDGLAFRASPVEAVVRKGVPSVHQIKGTSRKEAVHSLVWANTEAGFF